jgi:hypothetical protein
MANTSNSGKTHDVGPLTETLNLNSDVMSILPTYVSDYITNLLIHFPALRLLVMQVIIPAED